MSRRIGLLLGALALLGVSSPVASAPPPGGALGLEPRITLAEIHSTELSLGSTVALPRSRRIADPGFAARGAGRFPDLPTKVTRELPDLWRLWLPNDASPSALEVSYELVSARGRRDRLSHRDSEPSEIEVRVRPIPPAVTARDGAGKELEGGVVLELDVAPARAAGTYLGTLTITISNL